MGSGGETTDSRGALRTILEQPLGWVLLGVVAVGLAGYAIWGFVQAGVDPEGIGGDGKGAYGLFELVVARYRRVDAA